MPENKPQRLSDILHTFAPQGTNDKRWLLVEHQLEQVRLSAMASVGSLKVIAARPEYEEERQLAEDCLSYIEAMNRHILEARASFMCYLSGTDVPERIAGKEL